MVMVIVVVDEVMVVVVVAVKCNCTSTYTISKSYPLLPSLGARKEGPDPWTLSYKCTLVTGSRLI